MAWLFSHSRVIGLAGRNRSAGIAGRRALTVWTAIGAFLFWARGCPLLLFLSAAPFRVLIEIPALFANWDKAVEAGARGDDQGRRIIVMDGPFTETKEVVGGYVIMDAKSRDEEAQTR